MTNDVDQLVRLALDRKPNGIICDIDGTLSPIAPTPDAARLAPGARESLKRLVGCIDLVAVVSGRSAADASSLIDVPGVLVVGNHGLEWRDDFGTSMHPDAVETAPRLRSALDEFRRRIAEQPQFAGALVEDKGLSGSIHYRLTPDRDVSEAQLTEWAIELAAEYRLNVTHGRLVIELRPPIAVNKGAALRRIVDEFHLQGALFFGDDVTDIDGFDAFRALRDERNIETWSVAVADPEARRDVIEAADIAVESVGACVSLLKRIADHAGANEVQENEA